MLRATEEHELSDMLLVNQICAGESQAFEVLVRRYHGKLYSFIRSYLGSSDEALDVLQGVWTQLYLSINSLQENPSSTQNGRVESLKPWLFHIARNRCIDELRRRKRRALHFSEGEQEEDESSALLMIPDADPLPEECVERGEERQRIVAALKFLPLKFRRVIWLRYSQELTFDEIGRLLCMPPATAKTYYHRACRQLRQVLA
jgi:RNA polymerase sigma-70 factor (ECF subfamily)